MDFTIPEELKMVQTAVGKFVKDELIPLERDILGREGDPATGRVMLPPEEEERLFHLVQEMGLWGVSVPEELGGVGLPTLGVCLIEEELAKCVVPFNFGDVSPLLFEADEKQRKSYLQPLLDGEKRACLALFEAGGADPAMMTTTAVSEDGAYIINGQKICLANTIDAGDFAMVFAVTDRGKGARGGVTCFLVDRDTPGYTIIGSGERTGRHAQVMAPISLAFDNCRIPAENVLGKEGEAFYLGMKWLPARRIVRGARGVGAAERLLEVSKEYAKSWLSFGHLIEGRPSVQRDLADMAIDIHATRLMVFHAAHKADEEQDVHQEAAMVKVFATEMVERTADRATRIHGGPIYTKDLPLARLCRNAITTSISEQALELQRAIIARDLLRY